MGDMIKEYQHTMEDYSALKRTAKVQLGQLQ